MNQEIANTAKGVGLSVLKSKYFWYGLIAVIAYWIIKKQINPKNEIVVLPPENVNQQATSNWLNNVGIPTMNLGYDALKNEYFTQSAREAFFIKLLSFSDRQLVLVYNEYNKKYSSTIGGKSLTKHISSQVTYWPTLFSENFKNTITNRLIGLSCL
jgi:hypothetical protein